MSFIGRQEEHVFRAFTHEQFWHRPLRLHAQQLGMVQSPQRVTRSKAYTPDQSDQATVDRYDRYLTRSAIFFSSSHTNMYKYNGCIPLTTSTTIVYVRTLAVWPAAAPLGLPTYHFPLHHVLQPFALPPHVCSHPVASLSHSHINISTVSSYPLPQLPTCLACPCILSICTIYHRTCHTMIVHTVNYGMVHRKGNVN